MEQAGKEGWETLTAGVRMALAERVTTKGTSGIGGVRPREVWKTLEDNVAVGDFSHSRIMEDTVKVEDVWFFQTDGHSEQDIMIGTTGDEAAESDEEMVSKQASSRRMTQRWQQHRWYRKVLQTKRMTQSCR